MVEHALSFASVALRGVQGGDENVGHSWVGKCVGVDALTPALFFCEGFVWTRVYCSPRLYGCVIYLKSRRGETSHCSPNSWPDRCVKFRVWCWVQPSLVIPSEDDSVTRVTKLFCAVIQTRAGSV